MTTIRGIEKSAGIIIEERKLLLSRSRESSLFVAPGGKRQPHESSTAALCRELFEEEGILVTERDISLFGTFKAITAGPKPPRPITMDVYWVNKYLGIPTPSGEIAENLWFDSSQSEVPQGSIFQEQVIPRLLELGLID